MHVRTRKRIMRLRARLIAVSLGIGIFGAAVASVTPTAIDAWKSASQGVVASFVLLPVKFVEQVFIG